MHVAKKICLIGHECGSYKGQGGIATYIELTAKGFAKLGLEVHVIYIHGSGVDCDDVKSWKIKNDPSLYKISLEVDKVLEEIKPDFVECTDFIGMMSYTLSKRAIRGLDYKCIFITNHHTGIKEVWEWGTQLKFNETAKSWMKSLYIAERTQSLLSDANFSTSNFLASYLDANHIESYQVSPSYYEMNDNFGETNKNHYDSNLLRIISLGRFELRKKQELLIKATCELLDDGYDIETTLIGNSGGDLYTHQDYMEYCYSLIPTEYKHKFHFYDFMPYKLLQKKYTEYDLFVIPSPYENFPNTALEAINYGVTVVGSKSSGVADMIGEDLSDYCFLPNSVSDIKRVILKYNQLDAEERATLRLKQRLSLKNLTCFEKSIQERFEKYQAVDELRSEKNIDDKDILIVYQDKNGLINKVEYCSEIYYSLGSKWKDFIREIKYIVLTSEEYQFNKIENYYPAPGIISCFSSYDPYGTVREIQQAEKGYSSLTLCVETIPYNEGDSISEYIAQVLLSTSDVIFFIDEEKKVEQGISIDIKYAIDKIKFNYSGEK